MRTISDDELRRLADLSADDAKDWVWSSYPSEAVASMARELLALRNPPSGEAGEPVAWQWSDRNGMWYTVDTNTDRMSFPEQEELARSVAAGNGGTVRPLYALPTIKEPTDGK